MKTEFTQIRPEGIFTVTVERTVIQDTPLRMHYEYNYRVEARQTPIEFINTFTALVIRHRRRPAIFYAELMGIKNYELTTTVITLTGAKVSEWLDALTVEIAETLLRDTTFSISKIADAAGWDLKGNGLGIFSRWFITRYKCSPLKWRNAKSTQPAW